MRKLFALKYDDTWWVSSDRLSDYAPLKGSGRTLPAAYLDYMRKFERAVEREKAYKVEEQDCIDAIIRLQKKQSSDYVPEMSPDPRSIPSDWRIEPIKREIRHWWQFWK